MICACGSGTRTNNLFTVLVYWTVNKAGQTFKNIASYWCSCNAFSTCCGGSIFVCSPSTARNPCRKKERQTQKRHNENITKWLDLTQKLSVYNNIINLVYFDRGCNKRAEGPCHSSIPHRVFQVRHSLFPFSKLFIRKKWLVKDLFNWT